MLSKNKQTTRIVILLALFVALTGCAATEETSSSGSGSSLPALKVSVSGLQQGKNVVLSSGQSTATNVFTENEALGITTDGTYSFGSFASGISYNITVRQQPVSQTCTVTSGEGTLSASTTVVVTCSSDSYTISGTVVGMLSGQSVTLQNNSGDDLTVSDNMSFSFSTSVASGEAYLVTVKTQPTGQTCTPNLNSGVVSDNVSDVSIICSYTVYTVSGSVSGLSGTLVLQNNYGSDLTLTSDGSFSFRVASSAKYNVRVKSQPNGKCVVSNSSGTISADVDNVSVGCWVLVDGGVSSTGVNKNSAYSADNVSLHAFPTANILFDAVFGNNTFVAVGYSPSANNLSGVTFGNNTFVAVGDSGSIVRSTDNGTSWDNATTDNSTANNLSGVTFGNNTFVAIGDSGNIVRSTDNGTSWDNATTDNSTANNLSGVTFGNNTFVGVGSSGNIVRSTDNGTSWDNATTDNSTANNLSGVTFGNNTFVAVGDTGNIVRSTDNGTSWDNATSPTANNLSGVTFGNNTFVGVGSSGNIVRSTDNGSSFSTVTSPTSNNLFKVAFGNNTFVAVGSSGNIVRSTDNGTSWENTTDSNSMLYVSWSEVSEVGSNSQIRVKSYDNSSWSTIDGDGNNGINLIGSRNATNPSMADNGTHLFAVWSEDDGAGNGLIRSAVYDNNSQAWDFLNSNYQALNNSTSNSANNPQLLYNNSSLYVIWSENNGTANQVRVRQFDNSSSWNLVDNIGANTTGINKDTSRNAINPKMMNFNSEIYAAWSESDGTASQIRVAKFDNSSSWTFVDGNSSTGINKATGKNATDPTMAVLSTKLYLSWSETNADNRTQIRVKSYDGSSWSFVDGDNATQGINKDYTQNASYPQLVTVTEGNIENSTDNGVSWNNATSYSSSSKLYAVWLEENGNSQVRVAEFDGTSTWSFKDGDSFDGLNINTAKITGKPSAVAYLNQLIVAWSEINSLGVPQIRVASSPF
jgi:photosystem II stability/assembly factor-like uncharacterized protein